MSQVTHRSPTLSPYGRSTTRPLPSAAAWLLEGVIAAGLGLGGLAVLVLLLWIISPYPDSGAGGALHIAADLWLLAHGTHLVRTETLSGVPAPVALTPLLLVVLPVRLLYRACLQALSEAGSGPGAGEDAGSESESGEEAGARAAGWVAAGYLLTGATAVLFASGGPVRADLLSAVVRLPLFVVCVAAAAVWAGGGRADEEADEGGAFVRRLRPLRAVSTVTAVLCGGGLVLTFAALLWHGDAVRSAFPELADNWSGQFAVLLLLVVLLPNAAVWGAAYGLGPGFALGEGTVVGPLADGSASQLPPFPLLAALPQDGAGGPLACAAAACVPLAAGAAAGWYVARAAVPESGRREGAESRRTTVYAVVLVAGGCGAGIALLAACSGGAIGTQALASFGPSWWLTGPAAAVWTAVVGVPCALAVRAWRLRERGPDDDWHATAARQARWTALKTASGGLMPDFEPRRD